MIDRGNYSLRHDVYELIDRWEGYDERKDAALRRLYRILRGKEGNFAGYSDVMTDEEVDICRKLTGVHGYAYYKMLLVQRGIK